MGIRYWKGLAVTSCYFFTDPLTIEHAYFSYLENKKQMKTSSIFWVFATTIVLITVTVMATLNFPLNWVFYVTVIGQLMIVHMVYRVLTENYTTDKTFEDFYEDFPIGKRIN